MPKLKALALTCVVCCLTFSTQVRGQDTVSGSAPLRAAIKASKRGETGTGRIVGGQDASLYNNPWQVALVDATDPNNLVAQFCGGSIIAPRWVVTAAHCVDNGTSHSDVEVLIGTASLLRGGRRLKIVQDGIHVHPRWVGAAISHDFDIALVQVASDLGGEAIGPAPLAWTGPTPGQLVKVSGWGALDFASGARVFLLQEAAIPYVTNTICNEPGSYDGKVTDNMFCAGVATGNLDACQGDSGGPATVMIGTTHRLLGVVSWGDGCGAPDKYGVYTRIAKFRKWVSDTSSGDVSW